MSNAKSKTKQVEIDNEVKQSESSLSQASFESNTKGWVVKFEDDMLVVKFDPNNKNSIGVYLTQKAKGFVFETYGSLSDGIQHVFACKYLIENKNKIND